ncbi:MAG TPA: pyridoxal-dependent decarboxylase [Candidatus Limnocylindria bacterium]|nr:pyridoxal-dependent decarboxylase [Candidatus Limnocylindria bacterium]
MADPLHERDTVMKALHAAAAAGERYLASIDTDRVRRPEADRAAMSLRATFPEEGDGALVAIDELIRASDGALRSSGPRFFHWVVGGTTPSALAADWLTSAWDQSAFAWDSSPLGSRCEELAMAWLKDLFELPASWGGVLTTGATMANFTALAAARRWWAQRHGVDIDADGFAGLPAVPVLSSGYIHPSATKALAMLGIGRGTVRRFTRDDVGRLDATALEDALRALQGAPAIIVGNAGEVNAGDFDPLERMADLAERYGCWLHVDGAFGLFARVTPRAAHLAAGVERAHSVICDGHKWLNVNYDSGFAFVRDASLLDNAFAIGAPYLPKPGEHPMFGGRGPEASRRARGIAIWATLRAYGRAGHRAMVERHLELAQRLARAVDAAPELERLADVPLNIVCFRYRPGRLAEDALDTLNAKIGADLLADGRVYVGTTRYRGHVAFRPAIVNWRTTDADVDLIVEVVRELAARLAVTVA